MIVECTAHAAAPYAVVAARVIAQFTRHDLDFAATTAVGETEPALIRAGLAGVTKQVAIYALDPTRSAAHTVIPFRWVATGASGELFPSLEANLALRPADDVTTELTLVGSYEPPFGRPGMLADRLLLRRVAQATLSSFLSDLVEVVTAPVVFAAEHSAPPYRQLGLEPNT